MKYFICKKNNINRYSSVNSNDEQLRTLFLFFTDGIGLGDFHGWLDSDEGETGTNTCIVKKINDSVEVSLDFNIRGVENPILLTRANFSEVIDQWDKLIKQDPQEIIMYKEGESYRLEGHGFPEKQ